jgi:hypothetical protein
MVLGMRMCCSDVHLLQPIVEYHNHQQGEFFECIILDHLDVWMDFNVSHTPWYVLTLPSVIDKVILLAFECIG